MADSVSSDEIQKLIAALPPEVNALLYSKEMDAVIQQIGTKHQLHIDQIGELESEVAAAMIGISQLKDLAQNISDTLGIDATKSNGIVADVNLLLLDKIRSSMKKNDSEKSVVMPSAMAAASAAPTPTPIAVPTAPSAPTAPNAIATPAPAVSTPTPTPLAAPLSTDMQIEPPTPSSTPTPVQAATPVPQMPEADIMLSEPTVSLPKKVEPAPTVTKVEAPQPPASYKADPYREPIE